MRVIESVVSRIAGKEIRNVEDRIKFYIGINEKIIALGLFAVLAGKKLEFSKYFGEVQLFNMNSWLVSGVLNVDNFFRAQGLPATMAIFTTAWFFLYSKAVRDEMNIIVSTFSRFNPPHDWEKFVGKKFAPILAIGIPLTFIVLVWFIDNIKMYCLIVLVLSVLDIRGNAIIRQNLIRHFADERYFPLESDLHREFILRRRKVAENYWIFKPHLERIGILMIATVVALLASLTKEILNFSLWIGVAYIILCSAIALNELHMRLWRKERDSELKLIESDEAADNQLRSGDVENNDTESVDRAIAKPPKPRSRSRRKKKVKE